MLSAPLRLLAVACSLLAASLMVTFLMGTRGPSSPPAPVADHHIHVPSDSTAAFLRRTAGFEVEATTGAEVVAFLDEADIEKGVLLSLAYMFGRPGTNFSDEYARVKRENNYVARQAARYPSRLVAFGSVNPKTDYALRELRRCARKPHLEGLKLHLANSGVDLRDSTDVRRLRTVFAEANRLGLPIVVHLWTGGAYGRAEAETFIRAVLPAALDVTVQVAHLGGPGMAGESTRGAVRAFKAALQRRPEAVDNVVFDLGAVTADPAAARAAGDTARAHRYRRTHRRVARNIRRLGLGRVVFGSDYFARSVPDYVETLHTLPLGPDTIRTVLHNRAPYLR